MTHIIITSINLRYKIFFHFPQYFFSNYFLLPGPWSFKNKIPKTEEKMWILIKEQFSVLCWVVLPLLVDRNIYKVMWDKWKLSQTRHDGENMGPTANLNEMEAVEKRDFLLKRRCCSSLLVLVAFMVENDWNVRLHLSKYAWYLSRFSLTRSINSHSL